MRTLKHVTVNSSLDVHAKSMKKGDSVWVGRRVFTVKSNTKAKDGKRVIHLKWGSRKKKDSVTLVVPPKMLFHVTERKHTRITK